jgi:hypothetical protein
MQLKTSLILLMVTYIVSVLIHSLRSSSSIGHFPAPLILIGVTFLSYAVFCILIAVQLHKNGTFDWISSSPTIRNIFMITGMVASLYAVFSAMMIRADWVTYRYQSATNPMDFLAYTGYIWIPLLMIIPVVMYVFSKDSGNSFGLMSKISLILPAVIGTTFFLWSNFGFVRVLFRPGQSEKEYYISQTVEKIRVSKNVLDILYYTRPENDRKIVDAAWTKIKAQPDWEDQLIRVLNQCDKGPFFTEIYHFLSVYTVDHPEKLVQPFLKSLLCVADNISSVANNPNTSPSDLDQLNIDKIKIVINYQFYDKNDVLTENLSILRNALISIQRKDFSNKVSLLLQTLE